MLLLIGVLVLGSGTVSSAGAVPLWQRVSGFVLAGVGLVVQIGGLVLYTRTPGQNMSRPRPLSALTRSQRKELLAQVRGQRPVEPDLLPLSRHLAEQQATSDRPLTANLGLLVLWTGASIADPDWVRVALVGLYVLLHVVGWTIALRVVRQGRRFLEEHPVANGG